MRRVLFVAGDRSLTRAHAEALETPGTSRRAGARDGWRAARAHSALEAKVLVEHGARPFDVIVIAPKLPDVDGLDLIADMRRIEATKKVPLFLMSERGHDPHFRRIAAARYRLAGFIELPTSTERVRAALEGVRQRRRVLVVEPRPELAERYRQALEAAGFAPTVENRPSEARERCRRFDPDIVLVALAPSEHEADDVERPKALEVCAQLKRSDFPPKVLVYGPVAALSTAAIRDNTQRADDFIPTPFEDRVLVERTAALVGIGAPEPEEDPQLTDTGEVTVPATRTSAFDVAPLARAVAGRRRASSSSGRRPSALARPSARRSDRRVPCDVILSGKGDGRSFRAQTLDISHGGMFFELDPPFPEGTPLTMRFRLPEAEDFIEAEGRVAWVGASGEGAAGMGVEFASIADDDLEAIVRYVRRLSGILYSAE